MLRYIAVKKVDCIDPLEPQISLKNYVKFNLNKLHQCH